MYGSFPFATDRLLDPGDHVVDRDVLGVGRELALQDDRDIGRSGGEIRAGGPGSPWPSMSLTYRLVSSFSKVPPASAMDWRTCASIPSSRSHIWKQARV